MNLSCLFYKHNNSIGRSIAKQLRQHIYYQIVLHCTSKGHLSYCYHSYHSLNVYLKIYTPHKK